MEKILLVDDIETNRKLLRQMLVQIGNYQVIEAINGRDAIEKYEEQEPDLILMDINMPEMNGYQSSMMIKEISGENHIPIIVITALTAEASLAAALEAGGDDFISKPFNIDVLKSKINAHLRIRELNQQLSDRNKQLVLHNDRLIREHELIEHFFDNVSRQNYQDKKIIKYHMSSLSAFNGDLLLTKRGPNGGLYLLMGDFTGHGLTAAMGTLPVAMIFFKMVSKGVEIGEIAREINRQLNKLMPSSMFFAATLLQLNARGDIMQVWMGGMPEIYWLTETGELNGEIKSRHMPLGILKDSEFNSAMDVINVEPGDKVYLYSDGVTECTGLDEQIFGNERLKEILLTYDGDSRFDQVISAIKAFTGKAGQSDDITLVEMTCHDIPATKQDEEHYGVDVFALPWQISISLSVDEMRGQDPVGDLSEMLGTLPELKKHKGILHTLLSEMYSNALDHSILGLDSFKKTSEQQFLDYYNQRKIRLQSLEDATIIFDLTFIPDPCTPSLQIRIQDNGKGYRGHITGKSDDMLHGRGMKIINGLCESFTFLNDGKTLEVLYRL